MNKLISQNGLILVMSEKDVVLSLSQADIRRIYDKKHEVCPICKSNSITTTLVGYFLDYEATTDGQITIIGQDRNRTSCECGWQGIAHDLIEKQ